jgi:mutator protein MutT
MTQITAAAIFWKNNRVLLEKRSREEDNYAGYWAFPGGHKRKKEKIEQTLKREMGEELKVRILECAYLGKFGDKDPTSKKLYAHNAFLCKKWKNGRFGKNLKWFKIHDILGKKSFQGAEFRKVDRKILIKLITFKRKKL